MPSKYRKFLSNKDSRESKARRRSANKPSRSRPSGFGTLTGSGISITNSNHPSQNPNLNSKVSSNPTSTHPNVSRGGTERGAAGGQVGGVGWRMSGIASNVRRNNYKVAGQGVSIHGRPNNGSGGSRRSNYKKVTHRITPSEAQSRSPGAVSAANGETGGAESGGTGSGHGVQSMTWHEESSVASSNIKMSSNGNSSGQTDSRSLHSRSKVTRTSKVPSTSKSTSNVASKTKSKSMNSIHAYRPTRTIRNSPNRRSPSPSPQHQHYHQNQRRILPGHLSGTESGSASPSGFRARSGSAYRSGLSAGSLSCYVGNHRSTSKDGSKGRPFATLSSSGPLPRSGSGQAAGSPLSRPSPGASKLASPPPSLKQVPSPTGESPPGPFESNPQSMNIQGRQFPHHQTHGSTTAIRGPHINSRDAKDSSADSHNKGRLPFVTRSNAVAPMPPKRSLLVGGSEGGDLRLDHGVRSPGIASHLPRKPSVGRPPSSGLDKGQVSISSPALGLRTPSPTTSTIGTIKAATISYSPKVKAKTSAAQYGRSDGVIFAVNPSFPGVPFVYRTQTARMVSPERLNLESRNLSVIPILEGEEQLRLLNFENNRISKINNLIGLPNIIFLDLYNNQIESISGLSALVSLRVLMLGKNCITKIENLETLTKIDVLDLHSNRISKIQNLRNLHLLRVLNLAGNKISVLENLDDVPALTELNLRRNHVHTIRPLALKANLSLKRIFLSDNHLASLHHLEPLVYHKYLVDLTLDGNQAAQDPNYRHFCVSKIEGLKTLDMIRVTDDDRRSLVSTTSELDAKAEKRRTLSLPAGTPNSTPIPPVGTSTGTATGMTAGTGVGLAVPSRRMNIIKAIKQAWKRAHPQPNFPNTIKHSNISAASPNTRATTHFANTNSTSNPNKNASSGGAHPRAEVKDCSPWSPKPKPKPDAIPHLWHVEVEEGGKILMVYGCALEVGGVQRMFPDRDKCERVERIEVWYYDIKRLRDVINRLRRFAHATTWVLRFNQLRLLTNLHCLMGFRIHELVIMDNPVCKSSLFRPYVLQQFPNLRRLNHIPIEDNEQKRASVLFGGVLTAPHDHLMELLITQKSTKSRATSRAVTSSGSSLTGADASKISTIRQSSKSRKLAYQYVERVVSDIVTIDKKTNNLHLIWPSMVRRLVRLTLAELESRPQEGGGEGLEGGV